MSSKEEHKEELVEDLCPKNCVYRGKFGAVACCNYLEITGSPRGSGIKDCKRYAKGKRKLQAWTNIDDNYNLKYDVELEEKPKKRRKKPEVPKIQPLESKPYIEKPLPSEYADEQVRKTLKLVPKIKTEL